MEKFTNDSTKYIKQLKFELENYSVAESWKKVFTYIEISHLLNYAFSYCWSINIQNSGTELRKKEWNANYDTTRFNKGIYNLDRLAITENTIFPNEKDIVFLNKIKWDELAINENKGIVVDGLQCELKITKNQMLYTWNIDQEMNDCLSELIYLIRGWKRELS